MQFAQRDHILKKKKKSPDLFLYFIDMQSPWIQANFKNKELDDRKLLSLSDFFIIIQHVTMLFVAFFHMISLFREVYMQRYVQECGDVYVLNNGMFELYGINKRKKKKERSLTPPLPPG